LLQQENTVEAERIIFGTLLADGDLSSATAVLSAFPITTQEDQDWVDIQTIVLELAEDTLTVFEMDASQEQIVRNIAAQIPESPATSNAKSILRLVFGEDFPIVFPVPPQLKLNPGSNQDEEGTVLQSAFSDSKIQSTPENQNYLGNNYPDPFTSNTNIPYIIPEEVEHAIIAVYDITGNLLREYALDKDQNILQIEAEGWTEGVYIYSLSIEDIILEYDKMILLKQK